ncbi:hypothetical protein [Bacillus sp. NTK074B]
MKKKKSECSVDLLPKGCPGIYPYKGCTNPVPRLEQFGARLKKQ